MTSISMSTSWIRARAALLGISALASFMAGRTCTAGEMKLGVEANQSVLAEGEASTAYVRIKLEGVRGQDERARPPVNVALVIDKSGSMTGQKIEQAKEAAILGLSRLQPQDRVSVIAFDHNVEVVVPAGPFENFEEMRRRIEAIRPGGQTAIYAAVRQAANSIKLATSPEVVSRVILMSDGQANVGPSSTADLERLGREIGGEGISVTTIGLGLDYNEDLMTRLALVSDGNHAFVEHPDELAGIFNKEFGDVLSVVGQDIEIQMECPEGIHPSRVLGREAKIEGGRVSFHLNQIGSGQERYAVLELKVDKASARGKSPIAQVKASYVDPKTKARLELKGAADVTFSGAKEDVTRSVNASVTAAIATQLANERNEKAVAYRDTGNVNAAREALGQNAQYLRSEADKLQATAPVAASALRQLSEKNAAEAEQLDKKDWDRTRKVMRAEQYRDKTQQNY